MGEIRKIAAILVSDVVGYSRLAGVDEDRTLARLRTLRSDLIEPTVAMHDGRVVKSTGDGNLVEFGSVVNAVRCAIMVQSEMLDVNAGLPDDRRIEFRIGIHLGDVVQESDGDLMGDGVNIAARLEGICDPGCICLSEQAYWQVKARIDVVVNDRGMVRLKNIADPVHVYSLQIGVPAQVTAKAIAERDKPAPQPALPVRPSIAVLPFGNMNGDQTQDYFADGIVEDIITKLAQFRDLFVVARNSSFAYRGQAIDVRQIGLELGVRFVVEGSVRRAGERLRISGQLIDCSTGLHLWADRFDGALAEVFDLQDQIASSIVGAIAPKVEEAEIERSKRKPTENLDAYDYYLRGLAVHDRAVTNRQTVDDAIQFFRQAIERDLAFAVAYARAARCYATRKSNRWMEDRVTETAEATRLAKRAIELGRDDAIALSYGGYTLGYVGGDLDESIACIDRALLLNPNLAVAWGYSAWVLACLGEPDKAVERAARAMRLSPLDPRLFAWEFCTALAHFCAERYQDAAGWAKRSLRS